MYYGPDMIIAGGWSIEGMEKERMAVLLNIPLASTNAFGTLINNLVIDSVGRRRILLTFLPGVVISLLLISIGMALSVYGEDEQTKYSGRIIFFVFVILYLLSFSIGISSTPFVINSEIYPIHLAGTAAAIATAVNWGSNFIVASVFLTSMETDAGKVYTYDILASFALAAFFFVYFLVPETGGRRISENVKEIIGE